MELQFVVDENLCIGCGECAKDCPFQLIEMKNDVPVMAKEKEAGCVQCQHCLAVCTTGALSILGKNPADSISLTGSDNLFRGAPHLLIASSPKTAPSPEADCFIALTYFELLASSMGLGTVWSGLAKWALTAITPEILTSLGVPSSHQVGYMMVFGRPDVTYRRTVQRDHAHINRVRHLA